MKKLITICTALAVASVLSTSCNKKLKENMEELETSLNEEKSKSESLQSQVNTLNNAFVRTPLTVNFSTTNYDDEAYSFSGDYQISVGSDYYSSVMIENEDGTYDVSIIRTTSSASYGPANNVGIYFTYNPTTGEKEDIYVEVSGFSSKGQYAEGEFYENAECTQTLNITAFDFGAGTISFNYTGSTTAVFGGNAFDTGMNITLSYSGSLTKSYYNTLQ